MLGKDVKNKRRAVNDTRIEQLLQVTLLGGGKLVLEDNQVKTQFLLQTTQFLRTTFANIGRHVGVAQPLDHRSNNLGTRCASQRPQFAQGILNTPQTLLLFRVNCSQVGTFKPTMSASFDYTILLCRS